MIKLKAYSYDIDVKYYTKEDADTAIATLQGANDEKAERIVELQKQVDELDGVKKSAEQILQNLLDCGLIKEWYFNGMFNAVLKNDDPHLQIAALKAELEDVRNTYKESVEIKLKIWERCKKAEDDAAETLALLEERNRQVAELKSDIADLRDDKKLTDAILDERNAEIAELKKERDWLAKDRAQAYDDLEKRAQLNIKQDAEIKELKAQKAQAEDDCAYWKTRAQRERHHKYKRCVDEAKICQLRLQRYERYLCEYKGRDGRRIVDRWLFLRNYCRRWHERWLELADKFKEAK